MLLDILIPNDSTIANGEISLLNNKSRVTLLSNLRSRFLWTAVCVELQRELEAERKKSATLQDAVRERDKEYQKLKVRCSRLYWCHIS